MSNAAMIRRALVLTALTAISSTCIADETEYFEGTVSMKVEIETARRWIPIDELYWTYGTEETWTHARGNFRVDYSNSEVVGVWYRRDENREYTARVCDGFVTWVDAGKPFIEVVEVRPTDLEREIVGYTARAIDVIATVDDRDFSTRYWYAPAIPVDPQWFSEDRLGGFAALYEHIDSLVVGIEFQTQFSRVRRYATEIEFRAVSEEEMALPDLPIEQSAFPMETSRDPCPMPAAD